MPVIIGISRQGRMNEHIANFAVEEVSKQALSPN